MADPLSVTPEPPLTVFGLALTIHEHVCDRWRGLPEDDRLAHPFNVPTGMPPHVWRMSPDAVEAMFRAAPPSSYLGEAAIAAVLFGWPINEDAAAPRGTLLLEIASPAAVLPPDSTQRRA